MFAPRSARVARWLLMHAAEPFTQRQIARATDMTEGFVSRIVSRLDHEGVGPRRVAEFMSGTTDDEIQSDVVGFVKALLDRCGFV